MKKKWHAMASCMALLSLTVLVACSQAAEIEQTPAPESTATATEVSPTATVEEATATASPTAAPSATLAPTLPASETPPPEQVTVLEDILYASAVDPEAQDQYLDIYLPAAPGPYPVVLWAHGSNQDKSTGRTIGRVLAKKGIITVSASFRNDFEPFGPTRTLREVLENAACVLQFIPSQLEEYGADSEHVIWAGYSYGGWLGSQIAFGQGEVSDLWEAHLLANDGPPQQVSCVEQGEPAAISAYIASSTPYFSGFWIETEDSNNPTPDVPALQEFAAIGHNPDLKVRLIYSKADERFVSRGGEMFANALEAAGYDVLSFHQAGGHNPYFVQVNEQILALLELEE